MEKSNFHDKNKKENPEPIEKQRINKDPLEEILYHTEKRGLILILEDEPSIIKMYKRVFKNYNCRFISTLKEGEEELNKLGMERMEPSILITDYHLPDGVSTSFVSKVMEMYPKIKVILSSSDEHAKFDVKYDVILEKGQVLKIKDKVDEFLSQ
ncbi:MAG: response regulator [Candidatus Micrarchaeia archaeon]